MERRKEGLTQRWVGGIQRCVWILSLFNTLSLPISSCAFQSPTFVSTRQCSFTSSSRSSRSSSPGSACNRRIINHQKFASSALHMLVTPPPQNEGIINPQLGDLQGQRTTSTRLEDHSSLLVASSATMNMPSDLSTLKINQDDISALSNIFNKEQLKKIETMDPSRFTGKPKDGRDLRVLEVMPGMKNVKSDEERLAAFLRKRIYTEKGVTKPAVSRLAVRDYMRSMEIWSRLPVSVFIYVGIDFFFLSRGFDIMQEDLEEDMPGVLADLTIMTSVRVVVMLVVVWLTITVSDFVIPKV